jgi:hypothetical protein
VKTYFVDRDIEHLSPAATLNLVTKKSEYDIRRDSSGEPQNCGQQPSMLVTSFDECHIGASMFLERFANGRSMVDAIRTSCPFQELH